MVLDCATCVACVAISTGTLSGGTVFSSKGEGSWCEAPSFFGGVRSEEGREGMRIGQLFSSVYAVYAVYTGFGGIAETTGLFMLFGDVAVYS